MAHKTITRRECLKVVASSVLVGIPRFSRAQQNPGTMTVASLGGGWETMERKGLFEPFEKATGIRIKVVAYTSPSQVAAQEKTGNVEWDCIQMSRGAMLPLAAAGYLEKIDYDRIAKDDLAGIEETLAASGGQSTGSARHPNGVLNIFFTRGIAYNTKLIKPGNHPRTWAQVWDAKTWPGPRSLGAFSGSLSPDLEFALLADGVPKDKIYPIDIERAFKSLDRIRSNVAKFWTTGAVSPQMLSDGEVSVASAYLNRIGDLASTGAPVAGEFNEGELQSNDWCILKGTKNYDNAMKLIAFASKAQVQAAVSMQSHVGPSNGRAFKFLPADRARQLSTFPENMAKQFMYNDEWWAAHMAEVQKRWTEWSMQG